MSDVLRVLIVAAEATPFAKVGGLADVIGALPSALKTRGLDVRVLLPRYGWINRRVLREHPYPLGVPITAEEKWCAVLEGRLGDVPIYFLEHDELYNRPHLYGPPGQDYADNCLRFALLSRAALQLCHYLHWWPQVIHANDWQTGLIPIYLNTVARQTPLAQTASVLTIHNLAFQGWFPKSELSNIGLPDEKVAQLGLEAIGALNLLMGGILNASVVTTVSPTYAQEIQTSWQGEGLDGILRSRGADLFGVLNGIDYTAWDPSTDKHLPRLFSREDLSGKQYCKAVLQKEARLAPRPDVPLVGMVTRIANQKGMDIVVEALSRLLDLDIQIVLLGTGDPQLEQALADAAKRRPDRFCAWLKFDERLAHLIEAGSDMFLMPSRWEPCGLNQMYSMRYGTLPIVRMTGGLVDTGSNFDEERGEGDCFKFYDLTPDALVGTVGWAVRIFREHKSVWQQAMQRAMTENFSWDRSAASYEYFYRLAMVKRRG